MAKKKFNTQNLVSEVGTAASHITHSPVEHPASIPTGDRIESAVRENITILPELEFFIRKLNEPEFNLLKGDIQKNGCKEPIKLWRRDNDFVIVDGHHRYQICQELSIPFKTETLEFQSIEEVKVFMAKLQLGRRNLTGQESSYLRGMQYTLYKKGVGRGTDEGAHGRTREWLAKEYGVSEATIMRDQRLYLGAEKLPVDVKQEFLAGDSYLKKKDIEYIASHENLNIIELLAFLSKGGNIDTFRQSIEVEKDEPENKPRKLVKNYIVSFEEKFLKDLEKADQDKKEEMKGWLKEMLHKLEGN